MNFLKFFFTRRTLIHLGIGAGVQIMTSQYLKNHPELMKEENNITEISESTIKNKNRKFPSLLIRGGAVTAVAALISIITFLAENGFLTSILTPIFEKLPSKALSTYIREASIQTLPHLEKKWFNQNLVPGEEISLNVCDDSLQYLLMILKETELPFKEKEKIARSILAKYFNLKPTDKYTVITICLVLILVALSTQNVSGYYILTQSLLEALKKGKISRAMLRAIIRKLKKKGIKIDPELLEHIDFD